MDLSDYTVMIIDDEVYYRSSVSSAIEYTLGAKVIEMDNGDEALKYLKYRDKPDMILLDLNMPVMDGPTFLEKLRKDMEYKDIYVIPYTQNTDEKIVKNLVHLGIEDYIVKGLDLDAIIAKVKKGFKKIKFGDEMDAIQ